MVSLHKMESKEECMRVFKAAMWHLDKSRSSMTGSSQTMFLRELAMTAACDGIYDLSKLRGEVEGDVGKDTMERVVDYKETITDARKSVQVVFRHGEWARRELTAAVGKGGGGLGSWWRA